MKKDVQQEINNFLNEGYPSGWRKAAVEIIQFIPRGKLASYSQISVKLELQTGYRISPRTLGWLRARLYEFYRSAGMHPADREVPLHRIAVKGDIDSTYDSTETREENTKIRLDEGFSETSPWATDEDW